MHARTVAPRAATPPTYSHHQLTGRPVVKLGHTPGVRLRHDWPMAAKVFLRVLRTLIGLALVAGGVAIFITAAKPDLMPSVQQGNLIAGPALVCIGLTVACWPVAKYFHGFGGSDPDKKDRI
jgi:hypothetical protein